MLRLQPIDHNEANRYVGWHHRHHRETLTYKLCLAANDGEKIVGVLIAGLPVARHLNDGLTLEVLRCCTDGSRNACSFLYGAAWRAARALGYSRMLTYTLPEEGGASLRAAGWAKVADTRADNTWGGRADRPGRKDEHPVCGKWRWEVAAAEPAVRCRLPEPADAGPSLFELDAG